MNPLQLVPPKWRLALYLVYALGSVVVTYLAAKGHFGAEEVALWSGLGAVFGLTAASNVDLSDDA